MLGSRGQNREERSKMDHQPTPAPGRQSALRDVSIRVSGCCLAGVVLGNSLGFPSEDPSPSSLDSDPLPLFLSDLLS